MTNLKNKTKSKRNSSKWLRGLPLLGVVFLSSCVWASDEAPQTSHAPPYPIAGPAVAAELETLNPEEFPAFIEWMQRLDKHAEQLEKQK